MKAILIVDDDAMSRMFAEMVVKKTGADVLKADNGLEAVETVKEGHEIEVVLMDMNMPVMDGFQATRIIKSLKHNIPVIALTSINKEHQIKRMKDAGCDIILNKPVKMNDLQNAILTSIQNKQFGAGNGYPA